MSVAEKQISSPPSGSSSHSSPSNSLSLIKLDELSSFGATKRGRLPALIKLNDQDTRQVASMPASSAEQLEQTNLVAATQQSSLPPMVQQHGSMQPENKENEISDRTEDLHDFQVIDIGSSELVVGPSLPQAPVTPAQVSEKVAQVTEQVAQVLGSKRSNSPVNSLLSQPQNQLGDSLINMVVNLRTENQNLVRALETNNEYVKDRINEYRRLSEEAQKREQQFSTERAQFEHQNRKLQRQNQVLSDRLKSMESKLKELRLEVSTSLGAAQISSSQSSLVAEPQTLALYPDLAGDLAKANEPATMLLETTPTVAPPSAPMETDEPEMLAQTSQPEPSRVAAMNKEELSKHFDADKVQFYQADNDYMKLCDQLEKQLNDIGKRDYEICLLQQQLNIYRQDFRLERMANLEAKIQIERLKNDIDRLCLDRLKEQQLTGAEEVPPMARGVHSRRSGSRLVEAAEAGLGKLGQQLSKKAARHAAKAAKHAAKVAHREEKAAYRAATTAAKQQHASAPMEGATGEGVPSSSSHHHQRRHQGGLRGLRAVKSEVVSDLMSTANKAMLTGYRMASTHVNLALDKLSQFEQQQAQQLAQNQPTNSNQAGNLPPGAEGLKPSGPPSID